MFGSAASTALALLSAVSSASCTLATHVDVCDRRGAPERDINVLTEGSQFVSSGRAVAPLAEGGALVGFVSDLPADPGMTDHVGTLRGVVLSADGVPLRTCGAPSEARWSDATPRALSQVALSAPASGDASGLAVAVEERPGSRRIVALGVEASGCPHGSARDPGSPPLLFDVGEPTTASSLVARPQAVALGERTFAILWEELGLLAANTIRARTVQVTYGLSPEFLRNASGTDAAHTLAAATIISDLSAVRGAGGVIAVAWRVELPATDQVWLATYDAALRPQLEPVLVHSAERDGSSDLAASVALAFAHDRYAVAWTTSTTRDAAAEVWVAATDASGVLISAGVALGVGRTGAAAMLPSITPFAEGWMLVWRTTEASSDGQDVRAIVLGSDLEVSFANRACDASDFLLARASSGNQSMPAIATLIDGSVAAVWNDDGSNGNDLSELGVRGLALSPRDLLAIH